MNKPNANWELIISAVTLSLLIYQIASDGLRRRRERARKSFLEGKTRLWSSLWDKGRRLQHSVYDEMLGNAHLVGPWIESVEGWIRETCVALDDQPSALDFFRQIGDIDRVNTYVNFAGRGFYVTGRSQPVYQRLVIHLENLGHMVERPEAYF